MVQTSPCFLTTSNFSGPKRSIPGIPSFLAIRIVLESRFAIEAPTTETLFEFTGGSSRGSSSAATLFAR